MLPTLPYLPYLFVYLFTYLFTFETPEWAIMESIVQGSGKLPGRGMPATLHAKYVRTDQQNVSEDLIHALILSE